MPGAVPCVDSYNAQAPAKDTADHPAVSGGAGTRAGPPARVEGALVPGSRGRVFSGQRNCSPSSRSSFSACRPPSEVGRVRTTSLLPRWRSRIGQEGERGPQASICFMLNASCLRNPTGKVRAPQIRNTWERRWLSGKRRGMLQFGKAFGQQGGPVKGPCPWLSPILLPASKCNGGGSVETCLED